MRGTGGKDHLAARARWEDLRTCGQGWRTRGQSADTRTRTTGALDARTADRNTLGWSGGRALTRVAVIIAANRPDSCHSRRACGPVRGGQRGGGAIGRVEGLMLVCHPVIDVLWRLAAALCFYLYW